MFETLTPRQRTILRDKMDDAYDDITRLIHWAQCSTNGLDNRDMFSMQDMRTEMLFAAQEPPTGEFAPHDFHDDGTDPGNCRVCHTCHRRPALADGSHTDVPL